MFNDGRNVRLLTSAAMVLGLLIAALMVWRWASREDVFKFSGRHIGGAVLGVRRNISGGARVHEHLGFWPINIAASRRATCRFLRRYNNPAAH